MTSGTEKLQLRLNEAIHALRLVHYLGGDFDYRLTRLDAHEMLEVAGSYLDSIYPDWKDMTEEEACAPDQWQKAAR